MRICPSLISTLTRDLSRGRPLSLFSGISFLHRFDLAGEDEEEDTELEPGTRDPRFMIYWTTITKTSTTTSYLSTSTIASVICTPSNFIYKTC